MQTFVSTFLGRKDLQSCLRRKRIFVQKAAQSCGSQKSSFGLIWRSSVSFVGHGFSASFLHWRSKTFYWCEKSRFHLSVCLSIRVSSFNFNFLHTSFSSLI